MIRGSGGAVGLNYARGVLKMGRDRLGRWQSCLHMHAHVCGGDGSNPPPLRVGLGGCLCLGCAAGLRYHMTAHMLMQPKSCRFLKQRIKRLVCLRSIRLFRVQTDAGETNGGNRCPDGSCPSQTRSKDRRQAASLLPRAPLGKFLSGRRWTASGARTRPPAGRPSLPASRKAPAMNRRNLSTCHLQPRPRRLKTAC